MPKLLLTLIGLTLTLSISAREELPVELFAKLPEFSNPQISPSGKHLATTLTVKGKPLLIIQDFRSGQDKKDPPVAIPFEGLHINEYGWASDDRLIVRVRMTDKYGRHFYNVARLISVSRDGKDIKNIEVGLATKWGHYLPNPFILDYLEEEPNYVLAVLERHIENKTADYTASFVNDNYLIHKVNVHTGEKTLFDQNKKGFHRWITDKRGNIRVGVRYLSGTSGNVVSYYRESLEHDWKVLEKLNILDHDRLYPLYLDEQDENILIVTSSNLEDDDYSDDDEDLYKYDLKKQEIIGPYEDPIFMPIKRGIMKAMQGKRVKLVSETKDRDQFIVQVFSDISAPEYYYYHTKTKNLTYLAAESPQFQNTRLAPMQEVSYEASDGLKIPAYLTIPLDTSGKKLPVVVYPHGGPWARDYWGYDNYVQFFANRGYVVFQPQFRGSTGFGVEHYEAGFKQWGYKIQDDISDGVKWLITQDIADPERICILGGSFGGYAAAMGLIRTPELFKCGVSVNGVMDLNNLYHHIKYFHQVNREITNDKWGIEKASPYHLAKEIQDPLLLIIGDKDTVVNPDHSKDMHKKLKKMKKEVELVTLPDGEHWRTDEANEIKSLKAIDEFLKKHLANTP